MKRSLIAITIALVCILGANTYAQNTSNAPKRKAGEPTKEEDLHRLLELMEVNKLGEQIWDQFMSLMKKTVPAVPSVEWQLIEKEFRTEFSSGRYADLIASIYGAHFTQDEVKQLIAFYESPIGTKLISVLPMISQEAMDAGVQRGKEILKKVYEKLKKKGYSVPTA